MSSSALSGSAPSPTKPEQPRPMLSDQASAAYERLVLKQGEARKMNLVARLIAFAWGILKYHFAPVVLLALFIAALSLFLSSPRVFDLRAALAVSPIFFGFIFPLTFMMSATWSRREAARVHLSNVRSACFGIRWNLDELFSWVSDSDTLNKKEHLGDIDKCLKNILVHLMEYLQHKVHGQRDILAFARLHAELRTLMHLIEKSNHLLHEQLSPAPAVIPIHAAVGQIHEKINFLRGVKDTKTPWGLTVFGWIGVIISPILLAPHFAQIGCSLELEGQEAEDFCGFGRASSYNSGLFYAFIVSSLFKIVRDLEDPFDGMGRDDLALMSAYTDYRTLVDMKSRDPLSHPLHAHEDATSGAEPGLMRKITTALFVS